MSPTAAPRVKTGFSATRKLVGPRGPFGEILLVPGTDLAAKDHPATLGLDRDPRRFDVSAPLQRLLDLLFNLGGGDRRRDPNLVGNMNDTGELMHGVFGISFLK